MHTIAAGYGQDEAAAVWTALAKTLQHTSEAVPSSFIV